MSDDAVSSTLGIEARSQVERYLRGDIPFGALQRWVEQRAWQRHAARDEDSRRLIAGIQVRLGEYAAGYWSEHLLHESLRALLDR
jgi:hypothetical protein